MLRIDTTHHYYQYPIGKSGESFCRLRIYDTEAGAVVVLSELADNPGKSVTNAAAELATEIAQRYALDPQTTTWLEHYGAFSYRDTGETGNETFDRITFTWYGQERPQCGVATAEPRAGA
jgi:hypothetical protein